MRLKNCACRRFPEPNKNRDRLPKNNRLFFWSLTGQKKEQTRFLRVPLFNICFHHSCGTKRKRTKRCDKPTFTAYPFQRVVQFINVASFIVRRDVYLLAESHRGPNVTIFVRKTSPAYLVGYTSLLSFKSSFYDSTQFHFVTDTRINQNNNIFRIKKILQKILIPIRKKIIKLIIPQIALPYYVLFGSFGSLRRLSRRFGRPPEPATSISASRRQR